MSITNDLTRLSDLHRSGDLSDDEYLQAKARVLNEQSMRDQPPLANAL
ncbi:MAG: SHOCT domain-containing protein, partial [Betaproteobacteria bacterium]|nr:SHOCT domain-containing protein [Betaproteobacteria bacterium]